MLPFGEATEGNKAQGIRHRAQRAGSFFVGSIVYNDDVPVMQEFFWVLSNCMMNDGIEAFEQTTRNRRWYY